MQKRKICSWRLVANYTIQSPDNANKIDNGTSSENITIEFYVSVSSHCQTWHAIVNDCLTTAQQYDEKRRGALRCVAPL